MLGAALALFGACAGRPAARPTATLVVNASVGEASLWIDDRYMGPVSTWGKGHPVPAGFRRVEVRHPDYFSFFAELNPQPGEIVRLAPVLRRNLD